MRCLVIDCLFSVDAAYCTFDGKRAVDLLADRGILSDYDRVILLHKGEFDKIPDGIKSVVVGGITPEFIIEAVYDEIKNCENAVIVNGFSPFYDKDFIEKMYERHEKYIADFTYPLGYIDGLVPSVIRKSALNEIVSLSKGMTDITSDYLFAAISKEINSFDIETFIAEDDMRIYRGSIGDKDNGDRIFIKKIFDILGKDAGYDKINNYLFNNRNLLFTVPYTAIIEVCPVNRTGAVYYPAYDGVHVSMENGKFSRIIDDLSRLNNKIKLIIGGSGEPFLDNGIVEKITYAISKDIDVIVESDGIFDAGQVAAELSAHKEKITFVLRFDAFSKEVYRNVHPAGDFDKLSAIYAELKKEGFKVYRQIIRMDINEEEIENYIRNKETETIIIRKFSTFCGTLKDRKVVDLSPFERFGCHHLRRDLFVDANGSIPFCQYCRSKIRGTLESENLDELWGKQGADYEKNSSGVYEEQCSGCDDYYIFNF